jgi:hypothetical protein
VAGRNVGIGIGLSFPITNQLTHAVAIYVEHGTVETTGSTTEIVPVPEMA